MISGVRVRDEEVQRVRRSRDRKWQRRGGPKTKHEGG